MTSSTPPDEHGEATFTAPATSPEEASTPSSPLDRGLQISLAGSEPAPEADRETVDPPIDVLLARTLAGKC
jgi:hypothetical protein